MHINPRIILCIVLFTCTGISASYPALLSADHISINCGSNAASTALGGREWLGDLSPKFPSFVTVEGSSTWSSVDQELKISVDPVPYRTARVSRSQFSYAFQLNPGQKFIRLRFNPASYSGFERFDDLFTVEAGPFTLLANFSASVTADALAVDTFTKEFCVIIQENQPLNIVFSPAASLSKHNYAFINGIEIISVPSYLDYCHGGDIGVQVVGRRSVIYVDSSSALELVHRQNIKWGSVSSGDDITAMFGMWATIVKEKANNVANMTWRISVDVGFRYLIRIHLCELGLKMLEAGHKDFILVINQMIVSTSADILQERGNQSMLFYKNYMVMVEGHKQEGKRDIFISLKSNHVFLDIHGPLEGFEVFKLSNHDNSLSSPNPQPQRRNSSFWTIQIILSLIGFRNAIATVVFAAICLVNIIAYMLQQIWGVESVEEENMPSARTKRLCRRFSLAEIQSITDNFYDAFVIGKGGFGKVYKGIIDKGQVKVAIKRLKRDSKQGKREFWTEVETLSELRHLNLVPLIGYCNEQREMILVYEYMPFGTLADHIHKLARKNKAHHPLSWKQRLKICIGAGRGLDYLHTGHGIIHRDIKASNILLDENFVAKVSDFGLAKIESGSEFQSQASTNLKGTFGYIDPDYFRTRKLTTKSDIYSFGVVLLEVLCGRPAVEPWAEEDKRSLTMWARDNISEGQVDRIVAPSLREEISPDSLKTFLRIVEKCLLDEPKKRPAIAIVVIKLEFALEQQENAESLAPKQITNVSDVFSSIARSQEENTNYLEPNERTNVADVLPQKENVRSSEPNEIRNHADDMPYTDRSQHMKANNLSPIEEISTRSLPGDDKILLSMSTGLTTASSSVQNVTSQPREQIDSNMISSGKRDERKSVMRKLSRKLWPWDTLWKTGKSFTKKNTVGHALSAPIQRRTSSMASRSSTTLGNSRSAAASGSGETSPSIVGQMLPHPNLRIFSFAELKAATRNFRSDTVVGEGGFGKVYKGWLDEKYSSKAGSGTFVAVKRLSPESCQGIREWQSEVNFLGRLSHPNLVKLLGYGWEDQILFLVYEYLAKGSLENLLFRRGSSVQPLSWDIRFKILIGASRCLAFLHSLDVHVIYRDFKTSNILLDESYLPKLADFGLAKMGPTVFNSHVTTQIMGTHGYAAPEYIATGHLYVKSDVYSFGVVLVEMLTGLRVWDRYRPSGKQNLLDWIKPHLSNDSKMKQVIDTRLEGIYPPRSALLLARLSLSCLESDPKKRPSMQEVVETLEKMDAAVEKPRQPIVRFRHQAAVKNT